MGLFSKKKNISYGSISYYYPQEKVKYGKTNKKKYLFDQLITKQLIKNDVSGLSGRDNIYDLVKTMNFFHTASFVPKKTSFCDTLKEGTIEVSIDKLKSKINNLKTLIETSDDNYFIAYDWLLTKAIPNYDIETKTFKKDGFIWTIDSIYDKATPSYLPIDIVEESGMPLVKILPPLPKPLDLIDDLGTYLSAKDFENALRDELHKELKAKYGNANNIVEENFAITTESLSYPTSVVNVSADFTWDGQMYTLENYLRESGFINGYSNIRPPNVVGEYYRVANIPESQRTNKDKKEFYKFYQIMIRKSIPTYMLDYLEFVDNLDMILIKYVDTNDKVRIALVKNKHSVSIQNTNTKLTARYPLKGSGVIAKSKSKEYRLYRIALERAGYKNKETKKKSKKDKDNKDVITSLNSEDKVEHADIYQVINLLPALVKENRSSKHMARYFKEVLIYLDKLYGGFPRYNKYTTKTRLIDNPNKKKKDEPHYIPIVSGRTVIGQKNLFTPMPSYGEITRREAGMRILGVKRYVNEDHMNKVCFTGVEPNISGLYLYVNVKDFSRSSDEEIAKGIYKGYTQYGLNLHIWFGYFSFKNKVGRFRNISKEDCEEFVPPVMFRLESVDGWFNDGNQTIDAKKHEYDSVRHESWGEKSYQQGYKGEFWKAYFHYDDRCNITYDISDEKFTKIANYLPQMPLKLWYKIPLSAKKEIAHTTIILYTFVSYSIKVKTGFGKFLSLVAGIVLIAMGQYWAGALSFAGGTGILNNKIGKIVGFAAALYGGYQGLLKGIGKGGMLGGIQTASSVVRVTNSIFKYSMDKRSQSMYKSTQEYLKNAQSQIDAMQKDLLQKQLNGTQLDTFNVNVDFMEEMDWVYYVAYGNLMFNDFYTDTAYNELYKKYNKDYDRFS